MRVLIIALILSGLVLSACGHNDPDTDETKALRAAIAFQGDDPQAPLPPVGQSYHCSISVLSQPSPPATPMLDVSGICLWKLEQRANVWYATFTETWACSEFRANVGSYPVCLPPTGTHTWQYLVDPLQQVMPLQDNGNFAPDMKR